MYEVPPADFVPDDGLGNLVPTHASAEVASPVMDEISGAAPTVSSRHRRKIGKITSTSKGEIRLLGFVPSDDPIPFLNPRPPPPLPSPITTIPPIYSRAMEADILEAGGRSAYDKKVRAAQSASRKQRDGLNASINDIVSVIRLILCQTDG